MSNWDDADLPDFDAGRGRVRRGWHPAWGRGLALLAGLTSIAALALGGAALPVEQPAYDAGAQPLVGRTSAVCSVAAEPGTEEGSPPEHTTTTVSAVAMRAAPGREGALTVGPVGSDPAAAVTEQGFGAQVMQPTSSLVLQATGAMAGASAGATVSVAAEGEQTGLMAAPCTVPVTSQWFVGLVADTERRSELVLTNVDDAQAEVDLRFFGPQGLIVVPGGPGLAVPANSSRTVALPSLIQTVGPFGVWVRATGGRVSAQSRDLYSTQLTPSGAEWHAPSAAPAHDLVIPGVPGGAGSRQLVVTNPATERALVQISVLGVQGPFTPAGADTLQVPAESTAVIDLTAGFATQPGGVQLTSDQAVTAAVISTSQRLDPTTNTPAAPDIAIQPSVAAMSRVGLSAVATTTAADSDLLVSNGSDLDVPAIMEVLSLDGVLLHTDEILVPAHGTSTRRLTYAAPSYVVLRTGTEGALRAAVVLSQTDGPIAGLATSYLISPDSVGRAPRAVPDPGVAR